MAITDLSAFEDLLVAYERVSADSGGENAAYVSRETGRTYWLSDEAESDEPLPDDLEDETRYIAVPNKHDLNLGKALALRFVHDELPSRYREAVEFFRHRGAYRRFKAMLEGARKLEEWYAYQSEAVSRALRAWVIDHQLPIPLPTRPEIDAEVP
jgi:hypothetical protein